MNVALRRYELRDWGQAMRQMVRYYRFTSVHIRGFILRRSFSFMALLCQKRRYGWMTAVFITLQKDDIWLSHYMCLVDCAVQVIERSSLSQDLKQKLRRLKIVYVLNQTGDSGHGFFSKAFALFHLPKRTKMEESVWDFLHYMIGGVIYFDYYINQCKSLPECQSLFLRDIAEILHSLVPIINDVVSDNSTGDKSQLVSRNRNFPLDRTPEEEHGERTVK